MTVIAGIEVPGRGVVIAGESLITWHADCIGHESTLSKLWRTRGLVIGYTGSLAEGQLVRYRIDLPEPDPDEWDLDRWMATTFVDAIRDVQSSAHTGRRDSDGAEAGPTLLVGVRDRLYNVCSDYSILRNAPGYNAVGAGRQYALGVLFASHRVRAGEWSPEQTVRFAVAAACAYNTTCGGEIHAVTNIEPD